MPPIQLLTNDFSWNIGSNTNKLQNLYTENLNVTNGFEIDGDCSFNGNLYANTFILNSSLKLNESLEVAKDVTIAGSLFVDGSMTYLNVANSYVEDPVMTLGSGPSGEALVTNDKNARGLKLVYYDDNSSSSKEGFLGLITDALSSHYNKFVLLESITDPSNTQLNTNSVKDGSFGSLVLKDLSASLLTASSLLLNNVNVGDKLALVDASLAALNLTDNSFVLISTFENLSGAHYTLRSEFDVLDGSAVRVEVFNDLSSAHYTLRSEFDVLDGSAVRVEVFNDLSTAHYALRSEFDILDGSAVRVEVFDDLSSSHYTLRSEFNAVESEFDDLSSAHYTLRSEFNAVETEFDDLSGKHYTLRSEFNAVETEFDDLSGKHYTLNSNFGDLSTNYYAFKSDYNNALILDSGSNVNIPNDLHVSKNLVVDGSFVYLNTTTTSIVDPVIDLGLDASQNPLTSSDINDRGLKLNYYDGTKSNVAFSGFITSSSESGNTDYYNKFVFLDDVSYNGDKIILSDSSLAIVKALKFEGEIVSSTTQITSLTVDGEANLQGLTATEVSFNGLDVSNNLTVRSELAVVGTSTLAGVNATSLSVTGSSNLTTLVASDVSFSNLDISVNLNVTNDLTVDGTTTLNIANLSTLSVSGATDLNTLTCDDASFANVDVSVNLRVDGELRMQNGANYVGFNAHSDTSQNQIWNLPTNDGQVGQVIKTDGAGNLSWDNLVSGPAGDDRTIQFNDNGTLAGATGLSYTTNGQLLLNGNTTNDTLFKIIRSSGNNNILEVLDSGSGDTSIIKITQNGDLVVDAGKLVVGTSTVPTTESFLVNGNMKVDNGNITITNTSNYISLPQRGTTAPSLLFDNNTGLSQGFNDTLSIVTNGNERYRFGSNGELLIGGTSAGSANQILTSQGSSSAPNWSNITDLVLGQDVSLSNVDISGSLKVSANEIDFTNLPTSNPGVPGRLWNNGGVLNISS